MEGVGFQLRRPPSGPSMTGPPLPGSGAPIPRRRFSLRRLPPVRARELSRARHTMVACQLHHMLDARHAGPDGAGRDFLFVQSAGNGLVDGAPLGAYANGYFAGIDENLFEECFPEGEVAGISFGDVHAHTLVVGAARERTEGEVALRWDDGASVSADTLSRYQDAYDGALAGMGVEDEAMRSTFLEEVGSAYNDAMGTVALRCTLRPSEHLAGTGGGEVVDLCGAASTMDAGEVNALELLVYDEAGLLDAYR